MWILHASEADDSLTFRLRPGAIKTIGRAPRADFVIIAALFAASADAQTTSTAFTFSPSDYVSDAGARGIVSADFDNDGAPDFATANTGSNTVDVFMNREF